MCTPRSASSLVSKPPRHVEGRSLASILEDPKATVHEAAFSQMTRGRATGYSVRVDDARYTEWIDRPSGDIRARELYRYAADRIRPTELVETVNLADDPNHAARGNELSLRLDAVRRPPGVELTLAPVFGDHMVLQRDEPIVVWGRANPGVTLRVEWKGTTTESKATDDGTWRVTLPACAASSTPSRLVVRTHRASVTLRDVLIGEVWLCAGQSNMEWPLSKSTHGANAIETARDSNVRLLRRRGAARGGAGEYSKKLLPRLTPEAFCDGRWRASSPRTVGEFSAVGYFFGAAIERELGVPVGLIDVSLGGTPIESWIDRKALERDDELRGIARGPWLDNELIEAWCRRRARSNLKRALEAGDDVPGDDLGPNHSFKPGFMWSAAVAPLAPFAMRGVLWYQGESNAEGAEHVARYGRLFERMVDDWRRAWRRDRWPLLFVQLPGMERPHWPAFRDEQRRLVDRLEDVGMAVTIDLGDRRDVHPRTKRPVGERLARCALVRVYGREGDATGPLIRSAKAKGAEVDVRFRQAASGLAALDGRPLRHFELAGADGVFRAAHARIDEDRLVVRAGGVDEPRTIRYAWKSFPDPAANFVNGSGLYASPFRIDVERD